MKMSGFEKRFVNSSGHSRQVVAHFDRLLGKVPVKPEQKYLDVGCGNGAAPLYVATHYPLQVTGIDIDPAQIELAQSRSGGVTNLRFLTVNGTELPFEAGEFDIVATNKVTHHIPNWTDALMEMLRVLKPGGYLIYADLMFPGWVATVGQAIAGQYSGFPTRNAIELFVGQQRLKQIHRSNATLHFEGVFQKP